LATTQPNRTQRILEHPVEQKEMETRRVHIVTFILLHRQPYITDNQSGRTEEKVLMKGTSSYQ